MYNICLYIHISFIFHRHSKSGLCRYNITLHFLGFTLNALQKKKKKLEHNQLHPIIEYTTILTVALRTS